VRDHRRLKAFQLADDLVFGLYRATDSFARKELFGLTSQIRRAAVSVPANIVEGCARDSTRDYLNFLNIAFGSLREAGYLIDLSRRLEYLGEQSAASLLDKYEECARVLAGLMRALRRPAES
jgi:four helix bundle protein